MSERLEVVITGQDDVSKTSVAVSRGAEQSGKSVEQAGKRGAQSMNKLSREAQQGTRTMDDVKAAGTAVRAVFGALDRPLRHIRSGTLRACGVNETATSEERKKAVRRMRVRAGLLAVTGAPRGVMVAKAVPGPALPPIVATGRRASSNARLAARTPLAQNSALAPSRPERLPA